jgi:hypothetical protein
MSNYRHTSGVMIGNDLPRQYTFINNIDSNAINSTSAVSTSMKRLHGPLSIGPIVPTQNNINGNKMFNNSNKRRRIILDKDDCVVDDCINAIYPSQRQRQRFTEQHMIGIQETMNEDDDV